MIMELKDLSDMVLTQVEFIIKKAEEKQETNSQWFLNFEDNLNKLSVKY